MCHDTAQKNVILTRKSQVHAFSSSQACEASLKYSNQSMTIWAPLILWLEMGGRRLLDAFFLRTVCES